MSDIPCKDGSSVRAIGCSEVGVNPAGLSGWIWKVNVLLAVQLRRATRGPLDLTVWPGETKRERDNVCVFLYINIYVCV